MRNEASIINSSKNVPISASVISFDKTLDHMHSVTQLLLVLKGKTKITVMNKEFTLKEDDIIIINSREMHRVEAIKECIVLSVFFDIKGFIGEEYKDDIIFNLNTVENPNNQKYNGIRYLIYSIIRLNTMDNVNSIANSKAIAYSLFAQLMNDFKTELVGKKTTDKDYDTITLITSYINDHYQEKLTLAELGKIFNYTESYLSKLFKKSLNATFIEYYDNIRVNYSLDELALTQNSIENIAQKYGFENSRSYVRACNNILKCYPSNYRKIHKDENKFEVSQTDIKKESMDIILNKYQTHMKKNNINETIRDTKEYVEIASNKEYYKWNNPTSTILRLGNINFLYNSNIIAELTEIQSELKYEYIELTSIFTQTARMYKEVNQEVILNKPMIDNLLMIIYDLKLSPYFKFKYSTLTDNENLITSFLNYVILNNNYQFNNIMISVNFEETNEYTVEEKYTYFYKIISYYSKLKDKYNKKLVFLSPSIFSFDDYKIFSNTNRQYGNITDYFSINYNLCLNSKGITTNKNEIKDFIEKLNKIYPTSINKIILENFNFTSEKDNLLNDTLYKSTYLCKNIIDIYDEIYGVVANNMFDITIENFFDNNPYLGYSGNYTFNYTKKASYYANLFLSKIKNKILKKGQNYIVSYDENKIIIILNNYVHYSDLYASDEYFKLTEEDRYKCFSKSTNIHFSFLLKGITSYSDAKIKTTYINKHSGSSYDIYKEIGGGATLSNDDLNQMKTLCVPRFKIETKDVLNKELLIESMVEPFETKLIEITLK